MTIPELLKALAVHPMLDKLGNILESANDLLVRYQAPSEARWPIALVEDNRVHVFQGRSEVEKDGLVEVDYQADAYWLDPDVGVVVCACWRHSTFVATGSSGEKYDLSTRHYDAGSVTFFRKRPHILEKADADDPDVRDALLKNAVINSLS